MITMAEQVRMRPVAAADADLLLAWRNDADTRAASRSSATITVDEHLAWLASVLADPGRILLIGSLDDGTPVGTVRFDELPTPTMFEVSITVAPGLRRRGLSLPLLRAGEAALLADRSATVIWANIDEANSTSLLLFSSAGYTLSGAGPDNHGMWLCTSLGERH
jgi:RimJ/RimL family protein N-acetyltransferase